MRRALFSLAFLLGLAGAAAAQVSVQQSPSRLDASTAVAVGTNFDTVNTQSTATVTPPAGQFVYITRIELESCQDATGGAVSNVNFTSTGLGSGATASPQWELSQAAAASTCTFRDVNLVTPLKSATQGTNVTVVSPSAATHTGFGIKVYYYLAP
jgi:hypothetical protein